MTFCKHMPHKVITSIWEPKWSTNEILINTARIYDNIEHYIFQFSKESPQKKYGWFYLSGKTIRKAPKQKNGNGEVYVVKLDKREEFIPINRCEHAD